MRMRPLLTFVRAERGGLLEGDELTMSWVVVEGAGGKDGDVGEGRGKIIGDEDSLVVDCDGVTW